MKRFSLAVAALSVAACMPPARAPVEPAQPLPSVFAEAFRIDATGDPDRATHAYLDVLERAAQADEDRWQVPAIEASLDALTSVTMPALGSAMRDAALANRTRLTPLVRETLSRAMTEARGTFARGLIARALTAMAEHEGDAGSAERARAASGCVREALVLGPTAWAPVTGVRDPGPLDRADAPIESFYSAGGAFEAKVHPIPVRGRGCAIDLSAESSHPGVRDVIVDLAVLRPETIGIVVRAHGAAVLRVAGMPVLDRPFELGDGDAAQFVRVTVGSGDVRIVARVGTAKEDDSIEIDAFGEDGAALAATAPRIGSVSTGRAIAAKPTPAAPRAGGDEGSPDRGNADRGRPGRGGPDREEQDAALLAAAADLAAGDPRDAERTLWSPATRPDARPDIALVYARAVESAQDLSAVTRSERARSAYERAVEAWPASWEAAIGHALLAGIRRGQGLEILRDLEDLREKAPSGASPVLDAFEAVTAGREKLFDRAQAALAKARSALDGTALFADAEDASSPRVGPELAASLCDLSRPIAHDTLECFDALESTGDRPRQAAELTRLRALFGAPARFLSLELRDAIVEGDDAAARRAFDAMLPAERTLADRALLDGTQAVSPDARSRLLALAPTSRDAPGAIAPLLRSSGDDPGGTFDDLADRIAAEDRAHPILPGAATAVLAHTERYDVSREGLVHWTLFDERRVSGTMDVDENAQATTPALSGRAAQRAVRRRILKKDGRVLEPDRAPHAAQAHADLSQLEQGDVVEAVYEGWALPGDSGDVGIDTPDLLPDRTAVHSASIEIHLPADVHGSLWSHPLLGKATERVDGAERVLTWQLVDRPTRRLEDGVPKMDRSVSVSFSSARWTTIARALRETVAALDEHDPEISAWARDAVSGAQPTQRSMVEALVVAAGKALREADPGTLSDYGGGIVPVQSRTARTFLASHDGSRSWLVLRGLRELGIPADLVVAENDPYSADPAFPPHYGRFVHPLVVAHVRDGDRVDDVWIDADVSGPPLPAGRISPELRGRLALRADGAIIPLPSLDSGQQLDEVDVRLTLDSQGDARGSFAVLLRGREAQELAESLFRIVGAERQRALREVVLGWLPWANVDDVQLASSEGSWQVSLRADVSVSGYAQAEQSAGRREKTWLLPGMDAMHWSWPHARVSSLASAFATQAGRQSALAISTAVGYHVHRRIELPHSAVVTAAPGPLNVKAKLVEASRTMAIDGQALQDDFVLGVTTGTVPTDAYGAFVATAHRVDDAFLASTRVSVP